MENDKTENPDSRQSQEKIQEILDGADALVRSGELEKAIVRYREILPYGGHNEDTRAGVDYANYLKEGGGIRPADSSAAELREKAAARRRENLELNQAEFGKRRLRLKSAPTQLTIESTTRCNFHCRTCAKGYGSYPAEDLRDEAFERTVTEILPTVGQVGFTGFGEPLLSDKFDRIMDAVAANGSSAHLVTNGSQLSFRRIEKLVFNPISVAISVDGATKETFESIRVGGRFDKICRNLARLKRVRAIWGGPSRFLINFVGLRGNIHELPDLVRLAHRYGIETVHVEDYEFHSRPFDKESLRYDPDRANRCMEEARRVGRELGVTVQTPPPYSPRMAGPGASFWQKLRRVRGLFSAPDRFPRRCQGPWNEPYVRADGVVAPCCISPQYLGDLKKQPFSAIWNGWRYRLLRRRVRGPVPPFPCRGCIAWWGINGGNPGNAQEKEGLLVKAVYFFEGRSCRILGSVRENLRRKPAQPSLSKP